MEDAKLMSKDSKLKPKLKFHPAAALFPMLQGDEFNRLVDSIKENGLLNAIYLHADGSILDGRNRYRACEKAAVEPRFETYQGDDPEMFVVMQNAHRRDLDADDRALAAYRLLPRFSGQAKERSLANLRCLESGIDSTVQGAGKSAELAAKVVGSNSKYVEILIRLHRDALELFEEVEKKQKKLVDAWEEFCAKVRASEKAKQRASEKATAEEAINLIAEKMPEIIAPHYPQPKQQPEPEAQKPVLVVSNEDPPQVVSMSNIIALEAELRKMLMKFSAEELREAILRIEVLELRWQKRE
jgi:ParB-like chromosome segregation protein Spo0J